MAVPNQAALALPGYWQDADPGPAEGAQALAAAAGVTARLVHVPSDAIAAADRNGEQADARLDAVMDELAEAHRL
jgi:hypothetical protein